MKTDELMLIVVIPIVHQIKELIENWLAYVNSCKTHSTSDKRNILKPIARTKIILLSKSTMKNTYTIVLL